MPDSPHMLPVHQPEGMEAREAPCRGLVAMIEGDVPPLGPNIGISPKRSPSWHCVAAEHTLDLLMEGLADAALFDNARFDTIDSITSLAKAKLHPGIKSILAALEDAGLTPQLGHNPSSGRVAFTMPLPQQKQPKGMSGARQAVLWCMLGLLPWQARVEELWLKLPAAPPPREVGGNPPKDDRVLANRCLDVFSRITGSCVCDVKVECARAMTVRLEISKPQRGSQGFRYGPSYLLLCGRGEEGAWSTGSLEEGRKFVVSSMLRDFWNAVEAGSGSTVLPYIPCPDLRSAFGGLLEVHLRGGVSDWRLGFTPSAGANISVYLQGCAGCGKSSFVGACAAAMQGMLRGRMDPDRKVSVVKVSLNCETPGHLRSITMVRGLSDFSIERIVEQTICKGGTVILHLEEVPEDGGLQEELCEIIETMLASVKGRYPKQCDNIVRVHTSNYPPLCPRVRTATCIQVVSPSRAAQERCARSLLCSLLSVHVGGTPNAACLSRVIPTSAGRFGDMRPLHKWCTSVAYNVTKRVREARPLPLPGGTPLQLKVSPGSHGGCSVSVSVGGDALPPLHFSVEEGRVADVSGGDQVRVLADMCMGGWVKPGVVVMSHGGDEEAVVRAGIEAAGREGCIVTRLELREDDDKGRVYGHASEIRGGLFKLIDDCTNVNREAGDAGEEGAKACVIVCHVNEVGQYMLRELLDSGEISRTHRHAISKDRVLFVVVVDAGAHLQAMTRSRAHVILGL